MSRSMKPASQGWVAHHACTTPAPRLRYSCTISAVLDLVTWPVQYAEELDKLQKQAEAFKQKWEKDEQALETQDEEVCGA